MPTPLSEQKAGSGSDGYGEIVLGWPGSLAGSMVPKGLSRNSKELFISSHIKRNASCESFMKTLKRALPVPNLQAFRSGRDWRYKGKVGRFAENDVLRGRNWQRSGCTIESFRRLPYR